MMMKHFGTSFLMTVAILAGLLCISAPVMAQDAEQAEQAQQAAPAPAQPERVYFPPEDVEPVNDQDELYPAHRLSEEDMRFLPYLVPLDNLMLEFPYPIPTKYLRKIDNPIAELPDGQVLTVEDLFSNLYAEGRGVNMGMYEDYPQYLQYAVTRSAFYRAVEEEARTEGHEENASFRSSQRVGRRFALMPVLQQYSYLTRSKPVTDDDVEFLYEKVKSNRYKIDFGFRGYHIFLKGYQEYTVQEGETDLREIAKRLAGSEAAVTEIRTNDDKKEPRWVPEHRREELGWEPIQPGENLLVPLDKGGMEQLEARAQEIVDRLEAGEDFVELAKEVSDSQIKDELVGPQKGAPNVLPEIKLAVEATEIGDVTPMIRTKHGYHIFKIEEKTEEGYTPLDDVKPRLEFQLRKQAQSVAWESFIDDLYSTPTLKFNTPLLAETLDKSFLDQDDVVLTYKGEDYRFGDIVPTAAKRERFRTALTPEARVEVLKKSILLQDLLWTDFAKEYNLWETAPIQMRVPFYDRFTLARFHTRKFFEDNYRETTPILREFFDRNPEYFKKESLYDLRILSVAWNESNREESRELANQLTELAKTVDSEDRFIELVETYSDNEDLIATGGLVQGVFPNQFGPFVKRELVNIDVGEVSGTLRLDDGNIGLIYVVDKQLEKTFTFDEAFAWVAAEFNRFMPENMARARRNEVIAELQENIEWLYPETYDVELPKPIGELMKEREAEAAKQAQEAGAKAAAPSEEDAAAAAPEE